VPAPIVAARTSQEDRARAVDERPTGTAERGPQARGQLMAKCIDVIMWIDKSA